MKLSTAIFAVIAAVSMLLASARADQPVPDNPSNHLVKQVIDNELQAEKNDSTRWFYRSDETKGNDRTLKEVIETNRGNLNLTLEVNGVPVAADDLKEEEQKLQELAQDPDEMQKRKQSDASDTE